MNDKIEPNTQEPTASDAAQGDISPDPIAEHPPTGEQPQTAAGKSLAPSRSGEQKHLGRPCGITQEIIDYICARLAAGESLSRITGHSISPEGGEERALDDMYAAAGIALDKPKMPNLDTVLSWLSKGRHLSVDTPGISDTQRLYASFLGNYVRAREAQADYLADEILDVARGADSADLTNEQIAGKRLRIDALKWRAAKLKPKIYGDRVDMTHTGVDGGPVAHSLSISFHDVPLKKSEG